MKKMNENKKTEDKCVDTVKFSKMTSKILLDILNSVDEYTKDVLLAENYDIEFKGFSLTDTNGRLHRISSILELDELYVNERLNKMQKVFNHNEFENEILDLNFQNRSYKLKNVDLRNLENGYITIYLSSKKSKNYRFKKDDKFNIFHKNFNNISAEHFERVLKWKDLDSNQLDELLKSFDIKCDELLKNVSETTRIENLELYLDLFNDLEHIKNEVVVESDKIVIWIHPLYLFSEISVLKGLIYYELLDCDNSLIESKYRAIFEYCKEYKLLMGKNLQVIGKLRKIANDKNDIETIEEIDRMLTELI
ncbi:hypothetical protein [Methanococcus voltae]|uniref:Uncharacterized protein n=1 Tax=Methanococcus voltae (strain ATCC BAA-1334 / A3) TaxID=456320 RepID=D7DQE5_METV3|nr:hypothetical protein [Methanococcus voltae]MCS3901694.1 hypothetical protein [Methanococcus voltae]